MNIRKVIAAVPAALILVACAAPVAPAAPATPAAPAAPSAQSDIAIKDAWARPTAAMHTAAGEGASQTDQTSATPEADSHKSDMGHGGMAMEGVNSAVYMVIENRGGATDRLLSASGDVAETIEIHQTKESNGMMMMEELKDGLEVPANGSVTLKPASYHIMLMNMKRALKPGDSFPLTLKFQSGKEIPIDVAVREP